MKWKIICSILCLLYVIYIEAELYMLFRSACLRVTKIKIRGLRIWLAPLSVILTIFTTIKTDNPLTHSSWLRETSAPEENAWRKRFSWLFFQLALKTLRWWPVLIGMTSSHWILSYWMFSSSLPWKSWSGDCNRSFENGWRGSPQTPPKQSG